MQRLDVSDAVRPLKWPLGVKWLSDAYLYLQLSLSEHNQYARFRHEDIVHFDSINKKGTKLINISCHSDTAQFCDLLQFGNVIPLHMDGMESNVAHSHFFINRLTYLKWRRQLGIISCHESHQE
jgi:hypothetical protein